MKDRNLEYNNSLVSRISPILFMLLISSWPMILYISDGSTIYSNSQLNYSLPLRYNAVKAMMSGYMPLWNPHIFDGISLIGDGASMPFDPFGLLMFFINPLRFYALLPTIQLFLAGLFMYLYLLKGLNLTRMASLFGGCLAVLNPVLIYGKGVPLDNHIPIQGILWLPLILLFVERAIKGDGPRVLLNAVYAGLLVAVTYFSSTPNITLIILLFTLLYLLVCKIDFIQKLKIFALIASVSLLLLSIQLLPTVEMAGESHRAWLWPASSTDAQGYSLRKLGVSYFQNGFKVLGIPVALRSFCVGVINTILIVLAFRFKARNDNINNYKKLFILLLMLMIAFYYLPIKGYLAYILPMVKGISVGYMSFLIYFCAFVLIAYAFNQLILSSNKRKDVTLIIVTLFLSIVAVVGYVVAGHHFDISNISLSVVIYFVSFFASTALIVFIFYSQAYRKILCGILSILIMINLFLVWQKAFMEGSPQLKNHIVKSEEREFLKKMKPWEKMAILYGDKPWKWYQTNLEQGFTMNLPLLYSASISGGQTPMHSSKDRILYDAINMRYPFRKSWYWKDGKYVRDSGRAYLESNNVNWHLINLSGVKYIYSAEKLDREHLKYISKGTSYYIYENLKAFPKSYIVYNQQKVGDEEALAVMVNEGESLSNIVLTSNDIIHKDDVSDRSSKPKVHIQEYLSNYVKIKYNTSSEGVLVLTDTYDKAWKAYQDGELTDIFRVNYKYRGVPVSPGEHILEFKYRPRSFIVGATITMTTFILVILAIIFLKRRERRTA